MNGKNEAEEKDLIPPSWDVKSWDVVFQHEGKTVLSIRSDGVMDAYDREGLISMTLAKDAQIAWRDALLRELADAPPAAMEFRLQQKVKAALSASAGPSSPTWSCQACQVEQPTDRACDACGGKTELAGAKS